MTIMPIVAVAVYVLVTEPRDPKSESLPNPLAGSPDLLPAQGRVAIP
jgi:hypothetical protein